ncbi:hypothetical protein GM418_25615 [Maribellus comscasis]|uniref:Uncharacterized protein n=1 Tax=Maribellus comscasis TaxID=2681766 RepID=A0A6I6K5L8_9BACT|nr:hypothetical protein [Maribellus comscasis]QGY46913.1 hypothetical protein GM418_25615 [Maribellus comscasis]
MNGLLKIFFLILFFQLTTETKHPEITRLHQPSFQEQTEEIIPHYINFNDTIHSDTLYEYLAKSGFPLMYSRRIPTEVCIDDECRPVNIDLYWNNTGRYLGYKLPEGEFLSKTKHKPFVAEEYDRLHTLLGDPLSALAHYSISELVKTKDTTKTGVDAVSTATIAAVMDYIVPGAVYTSYTLWHIVYGETKREIELRTSKKLNSEQVIKFLNTDALEDKVWVLNHFPKKMQISDALLTKLLKLVSGDDIYLAERALYVIRPEKLTKDVQLQLIQSFKNSGHLQKKLIADKLKEAPVLAPETMELLANELENLNALLVKNVLDLFQNQEVENMQVNNEVALLLKNDNRYIASHAFKFLESRQMLDKKISKQINKYQKRN